jgi:hypothetical protein
MFDFILNFYYIVTIINFTISLILYIGYELWFDWHRNRQDFWFILLLMICLTFIPVLNLISLIIAVNFMIFLFVREPIMELFGFEYDYEKSKFIKKGNVLI